jgi:hypothetical protein
MHTKYTFSYYYSGVARVVSCARGILREYPYYYYVVLCMYAYSLVESYFGTYIQLATPREYAFFELVLLLVLCILYIVERVCIISIRARNNIIMYYAHHVLLLLLLYGPVLILATLVRE